MGQQMNRRTMLRMLGATGGILMTGVLASCAPKAPPTTAVEPKQAAGQPTQAPAKAADKIKIRVMVPGGILGVHLYEVAKTFGEHYPDVETELQEVPYNDIGQKTEMGAAIGDLQDVLHGFSRWHWLGCYQGWYLALDDLLSSTDAVPDPDDFYEVGVENQKWEGKQYGLLEAVYGGASSVIVWNRNLFEEAGVEPPKPGMDIMDLQELARKVANPDKGIFGIQWDMGTPGRMTCILRSWGKPEYGRQGDTSSWLTGPDGKQFQFLDNPGAKAFFKDWLKPLIDERVHPGPKDNVEGGLFVAGRLAMGNGYQAHPLRFKKSVGDKWDFHTQDAIFIPKGPDGRQGTCQESHLKCVWANSKNPEAAFRFAAYATSREAGLIGIKESGAFSGRKSVYRDPQFEAEYPIYKEFDQIMSSGIVEPYSIPWNLRDIEYSDQWTQLGASLRDGSKSWEESAPGLQGKIQDLFNLPRP